MKQLLFVFALLHSIATVGQPSYSPGRYNPNTKVDKTTFNAAIKRITEQINSTQPVSVPLTTYLEDKAAQQAALNLRVAHVADISALTATSGTGTITVTVREPNRGGLFVYDGSLTTFDYGITFPALDGGGFRRVFWGDVFLSWYGAKGDGLTDDADAIQAAINGCYNQRYIAGIGQLGGNVRAGIGSYKIADGKRIVIPNRVRLKGMGRRLSAFFITPTYKVTAADTIVFELSNKLQIGGKTNIFHTAIEDLSLNMNGAAGVVGLYSEEINEGSGMFNAAFFNIQYKGARIYAPTPSTGFGPQNFAIEHNEFIYNNAETSASRMLEIDLNGATFQTITSNSFVGKNATGIGVEISRASGWSALNTHIEGLSRGYSIAALGQCFGFTISGVDAQNTVGTSVFLRGIYDSYGYVLSGIRSAGGGFAVQDFRNQPTALVNIAGPLGFYSVGSEAYTVAVSRSITSSNTLYNRQLFRTSTTNPTTADIGPSQHTMWYNSTLLELRHWANIGGTLVKSAAYN